MGSFPADRRAAKEARRAENRAAWAAGQVLPRWAEGTKPGRPGPRTGPPAYPTGAEERRATKELRRAANRAAWAASRAEQAEARRAAREADRARQREADRRRAAAWHADRRAEQAAELAAELGVDRPALPALRRRIDRDPETARRSA